MNSKILQHSKIWRARSRSPYQGSRVLLYCRDIQYSIYLNMHCLLFCDPSIPTTIYANANKKFGRFTGFDRPGVWRPVCHKKDYNKNRQYLFFYRIYVVATTILIFPCHRNTSSRECCSCLSTTMNSLSLVYKYHHDQW